MLGALRYPGIALVLLSAVAACGEDDPPPPPPQAAVAQPAPAAAAPPPPPGTPGSKLAAQTRIEDRVRCPTPTNVKPCDINSVVPQCTPMKVVGGVEVVDETKPMQYCLQAGNGAFCGVCPERDAIRHTFKPRDFVAALDTRDPFMSPVILPTTVAEDKTTLPREKTEKCLRDDQLIATSYSYQDLKLVGIVAKGTQRKALMMGGPMGYIIKRGDCVGKEKAFVKDIGAGYITFEISDDPTQGGTGQVQEHSVQLYPTQITARAPIEERSAPRTTAPVVEPPPAP